MLYTSLKQAYEQFFRLRGLIVAADSENRYDDLVKHRKEFSELRDIIVRLESDLAESAEGRWALTEMQQALKEGEESPVAENYSFENVITKISAAERIKELEAENARWVARIKYLEAKLAQVAKIVTV